MMTSYALLKKRHIDACQALWRELVARDHIYLSTYAGWYAVSDESFYTETELQQTPNGLKLAPTGAVCEWVEEPSYFFRLSEWQKPLLDFYHKNPEFILPKTRRNEVIALVESGATRFVDQSHKFFLGGYRFLMCRDMLCTSG